mmetsp:Transcript_21676/g.27351  ORF Transcript_21676/g.27351 Transcript_21676/m.27351 type:complete len:362 (-) Transcript_21676:76-1161(-)|eukprot:CAMPEP_0203700928 /NCGR_PEP_ID=MMETSP0091-20130426/33419_1 /ASSEMBLY_ACC=CAM_ASM_001089 /TAXON_ID=426623 /ORGANISM="Chaetoceros affinis, Strain CCMP159" /LENGTH=361 /DNA_ID=CAMNT_0050574463 /DNA_START=35 /DNA_END=1120 /DNA_ORIENTATION=-
MPNISLRRRRGQRITGFLLNLLALVLTATITLNIININYSKYLYSFPNYSAATKKWSPFNTTNPHMKTWCPEAECLNSPLCLPCKRRHLFIISTARSGSTTLLRMFNDLPNVRISGENHNTFGFVSQIESNLKDHQPQLLKHPIDKTDGPFRHNTIPKGSLACISQDLHYIMNPPPLEVQNDPHFTDNLKSKYDPNAILGFKTVRLHMFKKPRAAARFLMTHFPCSRFIINVQQNITHQYQSYQRTFTGSLKKRGNSTVNATNVSVDNSTAAYNGPTKAGLKDIRDFHVALSRALGKSSAKIIRFDHWKDNVNVLNEVLDWLGYENCQYDAITHENENGYGVDNTTIIDLGKDCHYPFLDE